MFNRTLNRPMFRRGGRAGGGIMTGVQRQGYQGTDDAADQKVTQLQSDASFLKQAIGDMPEYKPYPYKGSDFFMGLGSNILAAPGGQPILQTIGQSSMGPLQTMMKQNIADYGNKQKFELGKYQENKDLIMAVYKNMDDDEKILVQKQMEFFMSEAGGSMTRDEALEQVLFRKSQSPTDAERNKEIREQTNYQNMIEYNAKKYDIGLLDAEKITIFEQDNKGGKYKVPYDGDQYTIDLEENKEFTREKNGNRLGIVDYNPETTDYIDGYVYLLLKTGTPEGKAYVKQGQFFIPYEDYISETISTE
jgi:hypothetical protein